MLLAGLLSWPLPGAADPAVPLAPGSTARVGAAAGESHEYRIELGTGEAATLELRQTGDRSAQLQWIDAQSLPPLRLSAGRRAQRSLTLIAGDGAAAWLLRVSATSGGHPFDYELALGAAHPQGAADRARQAAEIATAAADDLRLGSGSSESGGHGLAPAEARAETAYAAAAAAWQAAGDDCGRRQALTGLARLRFAHGRYAAARQAANAALRLDCPKADESADADRAEALRTLGAASNYLGELPAAITAQQQALALYRRTGDQRFQEVVLGNLSDGYARTGQLGRALDAAGSALRTAQAQDDAQGVEFARERLATVLLERGELNAAMDHYQQVLDALKRTPYPLVENMAWNDLGRLYRVLGQLPDAQNAYRNAESVAAASEDGAAVAEALRNQGELAIDAADTGAAQELFSRAMESAHAGGNSSIEADSLRGLARCAVAARQWPHARDLLHQAAAIAQQDRDLVVQTQVGLAAGDLDAAQERWRAAITGYRRALALAQRGQAAELQPLALASLAHAELAAGQAPAARRDIARAVDLVESQRTGIDNPAFRTSYFNSRRAYYELYIEVLMRLAQGAGSERYAGEALEVSERARARTLQDQLAERSMAVQPHVDAALLAEEREAEDQLSLLAFEHPQQPVDQAMARLDRVRGRIRAANPRYAELLHPPRLGLEEMRRSLDDGASLLEYWLGERQSTLWLLSRDTLRVYTLPPRAQIEALAQPLLQALAANDAAAGGLSMQERAMQEARRQRDIADLGARLGALLLDPLRDAPLGTQRVVVGDGVLAQLPFRVLDADSAHRYAYLPSLQTVRWLRRLQRPQAWSLALLADPVLDAGDERLHAAHAGTADLAPLPRLPHSGEEARSIAALASGMPLWLALGFDANRAAALHADWRDYGIVHFATHALIDRRHPELSGIVLSRYDAAGAAQDGLLSMNDLYNLELPAQLVVLSACETAGGRLEGEEGVYSLSRAFFYAGTRRVLASLWPVDDAASAHFMELFYRALLQRRLAPAAALQSAQEAMAQDTQWQAPHDWAGYVLQGDWR